MSTTALAAAFTRRKANRASSIGDLAGKIADGVEIDPDEAAALLDRFGLVPADVDAAVARLTRRRELAATLTLRRMAEEDVLECQQLAAKLQADLAAAQRVHADGMAALANREQRARDGVKQAKEAERELRATADDSLKQQLASIGAQRERVTAAIAEKRRQQVDVRSNIDAIKKHAEDAPDVDRKFYADEAAAAEKRLAGYGSDLAELQAQADNLDQQSASVIAAMLQP